MQTPPIIVHEQAAFECHVCCSTHAKQAFISHASKDSQIVRKMAEACCQGKVSPFLFEFSPEYSAPTIPADILAQRVRESDVIFVLLGEHVSKGFWTQAWIGYEIGVARGTDLATGHLSYDGYFSKRIIVVEDVKQGIKASIPRLDALLLFDFRHNDRWETFQCAIGTLALVFDGDFFKNANRFRSQMMQSQNKVKCENENCKSEYDVWILNRDVMSLTPKVKWIKRWFVAVGSIECPSCDNREVPLTIQRAL